MSLFPKGRRTKQALDDDRSSSSMMKTLDSTATATSNLPGMDEVDLLAPLRCTECDVTVDSKQHQNNTRQRRSTGGGVEALGQSLTHRLQHFFDRALGQCCRLALPALPACLTPLFDARQRNSAMQATRAAPPPRAERAGTGQQPASRVTF